MRRRQHSWVILILAGPSSVCGGRMVRRGAGRILIAAVRVLFCHGNPSNLISALQQLKGTQSVVGLECTFTLLKNSTTYHFQKCSFLTWHEQSLIITHHGIMVFRKIHLVHMPMLIQSYISKDIFHISI